MGNKRDSIEQFVSHVVRSFIGNPDKFNQVRHYVNTHEHIEFNLLLLTLTVHEPNELIATLSHCAIYTSHLSSRP